MIDPQPTPTTANGEHNMNEIPIVGDKVMVTEEGQCAVVVKVHEDGGLYVRFEDGDEGSYSPSEVEPQ